jgi:putative FmdB family regulatory protein
MPTYEYQCTNCRNRFEAFQSITAEPLGHCSLCGGPLRRQISGGGGIIIREGGSPAGSAKRSDRARQGSCSLETRGRTCCGRAQRCDDSPCDR